MENWKKVLISPETPVKNILQLFEQNSAQIALVVQAQKLVGTITDGDVRRGFLEGHTLHSQATEIMNKRPIVSQNTLSENDIKLTLKQYGIRYLPLLDSQGRVSFVYSDQDFETHAKLSTPVVIMAGGEGQRLRPLTETVPKPMVDLNGTPIMERVLTNLISFGFHKFYISINYLGQVIREHFGNGEQWGVSIDYLEETQKLGTAGCLSLLQDIKEDFFVINGDLVTSINFQTMLKHHQTQQANATVAVKQSGFKVPYGVILNSDGRVTSIEEKPVINYNINCGIYLLSPEVIPFVTNNRGAIDMPTLLSQMLQTNKTVSAFSIYENWYDIADIQDLEKVRAEVV